MSYVDMLWNLVLKRVIGRNVLLPDEQEEQHRRARAIASKWRDRGKRKPVAWIGVVAATRQTMYAASLPAPPLSQEESE